MTAFSLGARLPFGANSALALSLPQSFVAAKRRQKPAPSSEGAEAAPPHTTDFPQRKKCSNRFSVNAVTGRRYNPSVFSACETSRKSSSPYTGEPRSALRKATVMRTKILSVTPPNPLGVTAPLMNKGSQENGINAITCRGYNPSVFSAFIVRGRQVCGTGTPGCPMAACRIRKGCRRLCPPQGRAGTLRRRRRRFR